MSWPVSIGSKRHSLRHIIYGEVSPFVLLSWVSVQASCQWGERSQEALQCQLVKSAPFSSRILKIPNCKSISENSAVIKNCFLVKEHYKPQVQEKNAWLVRNQESQNHVEPYPRCTPSLNAIKPSVGFDSLQEAKPHGLEAREGGGISEDRPATVSTKDHRQRLWNTACKTINPVQTVQSLSLRWSLSSPKNNNQHIREHNK